MRKTILISTAAMVIFVFSGAVFAAQGIGVNPFIALKHDVNELQNQVLSLQSQVDSLQLQIDTLLPAIQMPMFRAFLFVDGIPGDINDPNDPAHTGWIRVQSFNWSVSQRSGGGVTFDDFVIVHRIDKASAKLYAACSEGKNIRQVILELWRTTGDRAKYLEYRLNNVLVASVKPTGDIMDGTTKEQISFKFERIEWISTGQ